MSIQPLRGETILITTRPHPLTITGTIAGYIVGCAAALAATVAVPIVDPGVADRFGATLWLLRLLAVVVTAIATALCVARWRSVRIILTTQRVMLTHGLASRVAASIALDRVQDTTVRQSVFQRLVDCGDVEIETAGHDGTERLEMIPHPNQFANALADAVATHLGGVRPPTP